MLMIIACHVFQYYENELAWWLNCGVQVFLIISGFLYGQKEIKNPVIFIFNRAKKILIPYYIYFISMCFIYYLIAKPSTTFSSIVKGLFLCDTLEGLGHLWFVGVIIICYFVTPYIFGFCSEFVDNNIFKSFVKIIGFFVLAQVIGIVCFSYVTTYRIACYIFGYFFGYFYYKFGRKVISRCGIIIIPFSIVFNTVRAIIKYTGVIKLSGYQKTIFTIAEGYGHLLLGASIFIVIFLILNKHKWGKNRFLDFSDKYSYYIYCSPFLDFGTNIHSITF